MGGFRILSLLSRLSTIIFPLSDTSPILSMKISTLQAMLQCIACCKKKVTVELNVEGTVHLPDASGIYTCVHSRALLPGIANSITKWGTEDFFSLWWIIISSAFFYLDILSQIYWGFFCMSVKADRRICLWARKFLDQIRRLREMTRARDSQLFCDLAFFSHASCTDACLLSHPAFYLESLTIFWPYPLSSYTSTSVDELPSF